MPSFKPMKGEHISKFTNPIDYSRKKFGSFKLDGIRAVTWNGDTLSNSLKQIANQHIRQTLLAYPDLDGEIIVGPPNVPTTFKSTSSAVRTILGEPEFDFYVFDVLSHFHLPFEDRLQVLHDRRANLPSFIKILDQVHITSHEHMETTYATNLELGYEGMMLRSADSMYKFGRATVASQDCIKLKPEEDFDAEVLEVLQGYHNTNAAFTNERGNTARSSHQEGLVPSDMCGGFRARDTRTGQVFNVSPGKLSHDERRHILANPAPYVGRICKYRHMTVGHLAGELPRMARWIAWREDFDTET